MGKIAHIQSEIDEITLLQRRSDHNYFIVQNNLKGLSKRKFLLKLNQEKRKAVRKLRKTLSAKECYYGPFKGEFGHFLAHSMPMLMYLHSKGVKIHYCGMEIHNPFLVDEKGESILHSTCFLRDFFAEVSPSSNSTVPPVDVQREIDEFSVKANSSALPFWNLEDNFYYWFVHRDLVADRCNFLYDIGKFYKSEKGRSCAIFPRSKGAGVSKNNGENWDYQKILEQLSAKYDTVYVCGHPSQSLHLTPTSNTKMVITSDNAKIIEACANSETIFSQHSGVIYISALLRKKFLLMYKGGKKPSDIGSIRNTLHFLDSFDTDFELEFCFGEKQFEQYLKNIN
ncbi:MAG: hypothetical protein R2766_13340 [Saprospiraceae bacterium]